MFFAQTIKSRAEGKALIGVAVSWKPCRPWLFAGLFIIYNKGEFTVKHKGTKKIETKRLILRRFTVKDAEQMFDNWASDDTVTRFLTWSSHENVEVTRGLLAEWEKCYQSDSFYTWCIELKDTSEVIGSIAAASVIEVIDAVEMGYCMGKEYWNRGIMTEALGAVIDFFFREVEVNRIAASHHVDNKASGRVMQKCGLKHEGTLRQAGKTWREICDIELYAIIRNDYVK